MVPATGDGVDFAVLRAHAASLLASYKVPRYWQAVEDLPRTPTSRVAKHRLPRATRQASGTPRRPTDRPRAHVRAKRSRLGRAGGG